MIHRILSIFGTESYPVLWEVVDAEGLCTALSYSVFYLSGMAMNCVLRGLYQICAWVGIDPQAAFFFFFSFLTKPQEQHSQWVSKWVGHEVMVLCYIAWLQLGISFLFLCVTGIGATNFVPHPPCLS